MGSDSERKADFKVKDKVTVVGLNLVGWIARVREDSPRVPLLTVLLDQPLANGDDFYTARECELKAGWD